MSEPQTNMCECKAEEIVLLPCTEGSNCAQITNRVAVKLDEEGVGRICYLAGIGAHVDGMMESTRGAKRIVALDGFQVACAKKVIEHARLPVTQKLYSMSWTPHIDAFNILKLKYGS